MKQCRLQNGSKPMTEKEEVLVQNEHVTYAHHMQNNPLNYFILRESEELRNFVK